MALDGARPRSRRRAPITSVDAGRTAPLVTSQAAVLALFDRVGKLADHELVALAEWAGVTCTPQRIRTARAELAEAGHLILLEGAFRLTDRRRRARVWAKPERSVA
ncbi:hypothetical protein QN351_01545 [Cryobacterium sp. 10C2]|uniref:hypothetical protein n=1 Tax=Cryobacterium sp. 10C2 TaxID=3048576 RepID=UPI002B23EDCE|nr:hypothetical protein [Cryobacterium sp. 10C2]MEB0289199.1 hypothetical protein [Cryobacterium sp. 10C2]